MAAEGVVGAESTVILSIDLCFEMVGRTTATIPTARGAREGSSRMVMT
jgi:hypothetical protein